MADGKTLYVILSANASQYKAALNGASRDTREFGNEVDQLGRKIDRSGSEIDKMSGRLRIVLDLMTLLGPAAVPIGAVAIPAVMGLANQLGIAALAGGSAMLAFQGVGDTLKAVEKVRLAPTAENLAEMHRLMSDLQPAARDFVNELDQMMPLLDSIQDATADGFMPHATDSLRDLRSMVPSVRSMMGELADSLGSAAEGQVDAFDSARGREFVRFIESEARPALTNLFGTIGNLTAGLGELWMGFDDLNADAGEWMLDAARGFDDWASGLDQTEGFREFVDYIRDNGPQVQDTLGAVATMLVEVVSAAAPLGGPVLQGLEVAADALSAVADSPIGPTLIAAAAAVTVLNRGLQLTNALMAKMTGQQAAGAAGAAGMFGGTRTQTAQVSAGLTAVSTKAQAARSNVAALGRDLGTIATTGATAGARSAREMDRLNAATTRTKETLGTYARTVAGAGAAGAALAVVSTEQGRALGLTNTAMLGLVGSMAGPWGAAAGATIGAMIDMASAGNGVRDSIDGMNDAIGDQNFDAYIQQAEAARSALDDLQNTTGVGDALADIPQQIGLAFQQVASGNLWGSMTEGLQAEVEAAESKFEDLRLAVGQVAGESNIDMNTMAQTLARAQPAMDALGISTEDLAAAARDGSIIQMANRINEWQSYADSAAGRTQAFADSVADLGNDALSTAESASAMGTALEALLSPTLNAEEATDAWRASLATLRSELVAGAGFSGFAENAIKNREVTRDYANTAIERLTTLAAVATTTEGDMARAVSQTRSEFIRNGIAAGISREAIVKRANAMGLTPKLVATVFKNLGITEAELETRRLTRVYRSLPKNVRTQLRAEGIPKTAADVDRLVAKYKLSEKERRALVTLKDAASGPLRNVIDLLVKTGNSRPNPNVTANVAGAIGPLNSVLSLMRSVDGTSATTYVYTVNHTRFTSSGGAPGGRVRGQATGGPIFGPGSGTSDDVPIMASNGEHMWTAREVENAGGHAGVEAIRAQYRAGGGPIGRERVSGGRGGTTVVQAGMPSKVDLIVDGNRFTAYVRGHAADVSRRQIEAVNDADVADDRRNW